MRKLKIFFICILTQLFVLSSVINAFAAEKEYSWFCVRSKNKQPPITSSEVLINKYGAVSIDRSVSDTSDKKVLYLTFDAGYENGNVERIVNVLREEKVTAAFFILDNIILKNTDLVTRMAEDGHLICNHTRNHKNLCRSDFEEIKNNIQSLEKIYFDKTGYKMEKIFRFPEGKYSESSLEAVYKLGYRTVFWSFAYDDWDNSCQPNAEKAIEKIMSNTHNGAIFLFHPTSSVNAEIMPTLIKKWRELGYTFGTLKDI